MERRKTTPRDFAYLEQQGVLKLLQEMLRDMCVGVSSCSTKNEAHIFIDKLEHFVISVLRGLKEEYHREERKPLNVGNIERLRGQMKSRLGELIVEPEDAQLLRGQGESNASPLSLQTSVKTSENARSKRSSKLSMYLSKAAAGKISVKVERIGSRNAPAQQTLSPHRWSKENQSGYFPDRNLRISNAKLDTTSMSRSQGDLMRTLQSGSVIEKSLRTGGSYYNSPNRTMLNSQFNHRPRQAVKISSTERTLGSYIPPNDNPGPGSYRARSSIQENGIKFTKDKSKYEWVLPNSENPAADAYEPSKHFLS